MDVIKRRYPRVPFDQTATVILREMVLCQDRLTEASIYQLGAQGCGLYCKDKDFEKNQNVYLRILDPLGSTPLHIRARIVWKSPLSAESSGSVDELACRYGLEFLWIKKEAGEELNDPVTLSLNHALRSTGYSLMQK